MKISLFCRQIAFFSLLITPLWAFALGQAVTGALVEADAPPPPYPPGSLPNALLTPGDVLPVTKSDICVNGYTRKVRNVTAAIKMQVFASYNIKNPQKGEYEIDHLISLELGGSNSIKNLWPQSYRSTPWNAHMKDALENTLHSDVCSGRMSLADAQALIRTNWIAEYQKRFGVQTQPAAVAPATAAPKQ